jgi:hypothetical protein
MTFLGSRQAVQRDAAGRGPGTACGTMANVAKGPARATRERHCPQRRVRHEAGEALGAIGTEECLRPLREHQDDSVLEVRATSPPRPAAAPVTHELTTA